MFTIGADPELFFRNTVSVVSAITKVGGSKEEPLGIGNGCAVQEDNVAAEFCIPPSDSAEAFISSIKYAVNYLETVAQDNGCILAKGVSAAAFPVKELRHPMAQVFGCDPDYNAWTGERNPKPKASDPTLRSAGGHVHIGSDKDPVELITAMDLFLGVPSIRKDADTTRRELYGKAGAFRVKKYGAEYRTLSNFWIWDNRSIEWVFNQTQKAEKFAETYHFTNEDREIITACINNSDKTLVPTIKKMFRKVMAV
jgi:hypothetical protein